MAFAALFAVLLLAGFHGASAAMCERPATTAAPPPCGTVTTAGGITVVPDTKNRLMRIVGSGPDAIISYTLRKGCTMKLAYTLPKGVTVAPPPPGVELGCSGGITAILREEGKELRFNQRNTTKVHCTCSAS